MLLLIAPPDTKSSALSTVGVGEKCAVEKQVGAGEGEGRKRMGVDGGRTAWAGAGSWKMTGKEGKGG